MKIAAIIAAAAGLIALILSVIVILSHNYILGITGAGFLRGATALYLLALVIIALDRVYFQRK